MKIILKVPKNMTFTNNKKKMKTQLAQLQYDWIVI
jgi:hypothetical protein